MSEKYTNDDIQLLGELASVGVNLDGGTSDSHTPKEEHPVADKISSVIQTGMEIMYLDI